MNIDYDLIVYELRKGLKLRADNGCTSSLPVEMFLKEYRTIGFNSSRQTGATSWIIEQCKKFPGKVSVLVESDTLRAMMLDALGDDAYLMRESIFIPSDVVQCVDNCRIQRLVCKTERLIVDDSRYIMERLGMRRLYKWVSMSGNNDIEIILV